MKEIIRVSHLGEPKLEAYVGMNEAQLLHRYEPEPGIFIAESPNVIMRALGAGYVPESILVEEERLEQQATAKVLALCQSMPEDFPVFCGTNKVLTGITGYHLTSGLLCAMRRKPLAAVEQIKGRRLAILESVVNPTNVGAIVRSAAALGVDGILFTSDCANPLCRRAIRVSMGNIFLIPWTVIPQGQWHEQTFQTLREAGYKTAAMALRADTHSIADPVVMEEEKLAILLGTEGEGLKADTIADSDYTIKIPMRAGVDSLNVAAAAAVAFWQLCN